MLDVTPQTDAAVARRHDNGERGTGSEAEVRCGAHAARWRPFSRFVSLLKDFQVTQTSRRASLPLAKHYTD